MWDGLYTSIYDTLRASYAVQSRYIAALSASVQRQSVLTVLVITGKLPVKN